MNHRMNHRWFISFCSYVGPWDTGAGLGCSQCVCLFLVSACLVSRPRFTGDPRGWLTHGTWEDPETHRREKGGAGEVGRCGCTNQTGGWGGQSTVHLSTVSDVYTVSRMWVPRHRSGIRAQPISAKWLLSTGQAPPLADSGHCCSRSTRETGRKVLIFLMTQP